MPKLVPLGNKVLVQREAQAKQTASGLYLPDATLNKEPPKRGKVISLGPDVGRIKKDYPVDPLSLGFGIAAMSCDDLADAAPVYRHKLAEGDTVLFNAYAGADVESGGQRYLLLTEDDVMCVELPDEVPPSTTTSPPVDKSCKRRVAAGRKNGSSAAKV